MPDVLPFLVMEDSRCGNIGSCNKNDTRCARWKVHAPPGGSCYMIRNIHVPHVESRLNVTRKDFVVTCNRWSHSRCSGVSDAQYVRLSAGIWIRFRRHGTVLHVHFNSCLLPILVLWVTLVLLVLFQMFPMRMRVTRFFVKNDLYHTTSIMAFREVHQLCNNYLFIFINS